MKSFILIVTVTMFATIASAGQIGSGVVRRSGDSWADNLGSTYSNRLWWLSLGSLREQDVRVKT